jgi:hypothetical protein
MDIYSQLCVPFSNVGLPLWADILINAMHAGTFV